MHIFIGTLSPTGVIPSSMSRQQRPVVVSRASNECTAQYSTAQRVLEDVRQPGLCSHQFVCDAAGGWCPKSCCWQPWLKGVQINGRLCDGWMSHTSVLAILLICRLSVGPSIPDGLTSNLCFRGVWGLSRLSLALTKNYRSFYNTTPTFPNNSQGISSRGRTHIVQPPLYMLIMLASVITWAII